MVVMANHHVKVILKAMFVWNVSLPKMLPSMQDKQLLQQGLFSNNPEGHGWHFITHHQSIIHPSIAITVYSSNFITLLWTYMYIPRIIFYC